MLAQVLAPGSQQKEANSDVCITRLAAPSLLPAIHLLNYWKGLQPSGGLIVGQHVPSRTLAKLLSNMLVYEPVFDGTDFRVRLAGTSVRRRFGREISGALLSEVYPADQFERLRAVMLSVITLRMPHCDDVVIRRREDPLHFETVHVPVYAPDGVTQWGLVGFFFFGENVPLKAVSKD